MILFTSISILYSICMLLNYLEFFILWEDPQTFLDKVRVGLIMMAGPVLTLVFARKIYQRVNDDTGY